MESPWYHGIMLIVLMGAFIGLWIWAWSRKRKETFREASMLPLEEDNGIIPGNEQKKD
jgi:cytochrome c oxidase cbb3-type subunit 4